MISTAFFGFSFNFSFMPFLASLFVGLSGCIPLVRVDSFLVGQAFQALTTPSPNYHNPTPPVDVFRWSKL